jgi:hypothetical protein
MFVATTTYNYMQNSTAAKHILLKLLFPGQQRPRAILSPNQRFHLFIVSMNRSELQIIILL